MNRLNRHHRPRRTYTAEALIEVLETRRLLSAASSSEPADEAVLAPAIAVDASDSADSGSTGAATATAEAAVFAHPSILHTEADFDRMRQKVAAGAQPWAAGFNALISDGYSQTGWNPRPTQTVIRGGDGSNFGGMIVDMLRAYQTAVRWKVS